MTPWGSAASLVQQKRCGYHPRVKVTEFGWDKMISFDSFVMCVVSCLFVGKTRFFRILYSIWVSMRNSGSAKVRKYAMCSPVFTRWPLVVVVCTFQTKLYRNKLGSIPEVCYLPNIPRRVSNPISKVRIYSQLQLISLLSCLSLELENIFLTKHEVFHGK